LIIYEECYTKQGTFRFIFDEEGQVIRIILTDKHWFSLIADHTLKRSHNFGKTISRQFKEYLYGDRKQFDIPVVLKGTTFQKKTWKDVQKIPYGETRTYTEVAVSIGNPRAVRAVGNTIATNPLPIFIPCHRVLGKDYNLTGYVGGINMKKWLLEKESI